MRTDRMRRSDNIEDRRGMGPRMVAGGGFGLVGIVVVVLYILLGGNPQALLQGGGPLGPGGGLGSPNIGGVAPSSPAEQAAADLVARVLGDTEDVWTRLFADMGQTYEPPTLVLFTGSVDSGCGMASAAVGPFYCPADRKIYIDLAFYEQLSKQFGAPGDFAQAYVLAHEVGHHVQHLLGLTREVDAARGRVSEAKYNDLSVRLELQADFLAGVWAHHAQATRDILESGDVDEGLRAAAAVGDDTLQRNTQGYVVPDSFTHGTSDQRAKWFRLGFQTGDIRKGDTFAVDRP